MGIVRTLFALLLLLAAPAGAATVTLKNGNVLTGEVVEESDDEIVLRHPDLGDLHIARERYQELATGESSGLSSGVVAQSSLPQQADQAKRRGLFGTRILRGWKNRLGAGLSGSAGGFEDTKLNVLFNTEIENEERRWDFTSAYFLNVTPKKDGQAETTTKNQGFAQLRRKWFFPDSERWSRFFGVARTRYDYDAFQPWEHRIAASAGPGYRILMSEKWDFAANVGAGISQTFGQSDLFAPEWTVGFDLTWKPNSWNTVQTSNQLFVDFRTVKRHRTVQNLDWNIDLGDPGGVGFRLGLLYQFDTDSVGRSNDLTYLSSITYDF